MNWRKVIQFTLVHVGVAITAVPISSTLNRIMIADMQLSALLVSVLVALPYLLSPLQILVGNWADHHPLWGRHRSPWILIGGLMASFGCYAAPHAIFMLPDNYALGLAAATLAFTIWGVGVNVASVSYLSLLSEASEGHTGWRSRTVSIMFTTMILATIVTSIALSRMLDPFSVSALYTAFGVIWLIATFFVIFGAAGIEPAPDPGQRVQNSADNPATALRALANNATARRFFVYLLLVLISIHAQDVLLEPYGADVLGMSVSATSRLTAIWGVGVLLTMVGGLPVVRRVGKKRAANIGAVVAAIGFAAIVLTGLLQQVNLFMAAVFVLGLGGGLMTVSNLSFMLDMTVTGAAGLYMGAWGVANFAGQSLGSISSGLIRDVAYGITGSNLFGYVIVFGLEIAGLIIAMILFRTISVVEFQQEAATNLPELLAMAGD